MPQACPTASPWTARPASWRRGTTRAPTHAAPPGGPSRRRVPRVGDDGTRSVLAERFQGKRLNSPNDIVVKSDGSIYFTDPPYAVRPATPGMVRPPEWWTKPIPGPEP